jgi:hypothetical protein
MTREELREKVARAVAQYHGWAHWREEPEWARLNNLFFAQADAAIALCMEEAAKVAESAPHWTDNGPPLGKMPTGRNDIAAAIRALKDTTGIEKSGGTS